MLQSCERIKSAPNEAFDVHNERTPAQPCSIALSIKSGSEWMRGCTATAGRGAQPNMLLIKHESPERLLSQFMLSVREAAAWIFYIKDRFTFNTLSASGSCSWRLMLVVSRHFTASSGPCHID